MVPEAYGFEQKSFSPNEVAKVALCRLQALGLAWQLTRHGKYKSRAAQEMKALCALPHWGKQFLATATIMQALAIGYDWLHDGLSATDRAQVIDALLEKGVDRAIGEFESSPPANWVVLPSNWNIVCNASLLMVAIAVEGDSGDGRFTKVRELARASIVNGLKLLDDDGSWRLEGPGYWHLATEHLTYALAVAATAAPDLKAVIAAPGIAHTGLYRCYMAGPSKLLFNYGDSPEKRPGLWWLRWLGTEYNSPLLHQIAEDRTKDSGTAPVVHPMDLIWRRDPEDEAPGEPLPTARVFAEAAVLRGPWGDPHAAYVGIKGGQTSGRRSHTHLDLGHFIYEVGGARWASDLPPDEYTDCYLTPPERYRFYRAGTQGHNTIMLDGADQAFAADARGDQVAARLLGPVVDRGVASVEVDLSPAYPKAGALRRLFSLDQDGSLTISDVIEADEPIELVWRMHTRAVVQCQGAAASLVMPRAKEFAPPVVTLALNIVEGEGAVLDAIPARAATPYEGCGAVELDNDGYTCVRISVPLSAGTSRLVVRLTPIPLQAHS